jgi:GntR family transcriptional regulator
MKRIQKQEIRRDLNVPYYEQLKRLIMQDIENKGLQPGDLLPSETQHCEIHQVSRTVVRQAISDLVAEGLLIRLRGKGTFVAKPKLREQFMESTVGFFEDLTSQGHKVMSKVLTLDFVSCTPHVAEVLGLSGNSQVIELVRLRSVNNEIIALTKSYLNSSSLELLEELRATDLAHTSLYQFLEMRWSLQIESGHRSIEAIAATGPLCKLLDVRSGDPLLFIQSYGKDTNGKTIEFFQAWHRADRSKIEMNVIRGAVNKYAKMSELMDG